MIHYKCNSIDLSILIFIGEYEKQIRPYFNLCVSCSSCQIFLSATCYMNYAAFSYYNATVVKALNDKPLGESPVLLFVW